MSDPRPLDEYAPSCGLLPGLLPHGPGWYLVSLGNATVEAGPYRTETDALQASLWMDDEGLGVNPQPYQPIYSWRGLVIGSRRRQGRPRRTLTPAR